MRAAADMNIVDISPDASEFLLVKADVNDESGHGSLWTVPVLGGSPKRVGDVLAKSATFSQDGHLIAYTEWQAIGVIGSDGQNRKEVWKAPRNIDGWAHFSPDARRIRFTIDGENSDTPVKIWEVNVDGTNVHPIKLDWPTSVDQFDGQWTPDGRHFVFTSGRMGLAGIYEVLEPRWFEFWKRPRASLISPVQMDVEAVTPSRDSSGLFAIGRTPQGTMQSFDPKQKRWIPYLGGINASTMLVSPDKQWIAYTDYPRHFLWRSKPDGRERLQLNSMFTWMPQWSPNSKEIAFTDGIEIYKVAFDGGVPEKLTSEGQFEISPSWWPDGKSIVFSDFPDPGHRAGLKILDLASRMVWIMPNTQTFHVGIWAPDGKYMTAIASPPIRMVLYSAETGKWTDLKKFQTDPGFFVWSPDSKALYMLKLTPEPGDEQGVYRLSVPDGNWQLAASLVGVNPSDDFHENAPAFSPRASSWI
jgi:Tol biopolymer transport system component